MWSTVRPVAPSTKPVTFNGPRPEGSVVTRPPQQMLKATVTEPEMAAVSPSPARVDQFESGPAAPPAKARPALVRGTTGGAVRKLQKTLYALGFLSADAMATGPGVFGPRTEQALKAFQDAQGLKPNGQLDALTELALQKAVQQR
jgi:murein L,D-transpeptidase YcbB/YkuD